MNCCVIEKIDSTALCELKPGDVFVVALTPYIKIDDKSLLKFYCNCDCSFCEYKPNVNPYSIMAVDLRTGGIKTFTKDMRVKPVKDYKFEVKV